MSEQGFCEDDDFPCNRARPCFRWCCSGARDSRCRWRWWPWNWRGGWTFRWSGELPGRFLLRVPQADHLLDPATGRRLYPTDCRELPLRLQGPKSELQAAYLKQASPGKSSSVCRATCDNCTAPPASRWPR